jgi:glutathione S-transferase
VPLLRDGRTVVFETDDHSQVIAKYLETKLKLGLFPPQWDGLQRILWRYLEDDIEAVTFKLNDIHYREFVPKAEQLAYLRHKERKFGRGCVDQWSAGQRALVAELTELLLPLEQMLGTRRFLLDDRPRFVDFDLWGMLANFLHSGHYRIPASRPRLRAWHRRMSLLQLNDCPQ